MRKMAGWMVVALLYSLVLAGCEEVPFTGRSQLNLVPDSLINSMSIQQYSQFIAASKLSTDSAKTAMVKRVGERIVKAVQEYSQKQGLEDRFAGYQWEFNLVEDPNINAFAMPGGKVVVYTGILPVTQTEAGLATVVGHEIAHVFAKHGSERMTQGLAKEGLLYGLSKALEEQPETTRSIFMTSFGLATDVGFILRYSRTHESEADHLGLIFMAMAGYDPHEAVPFWQRMAEQSKGRAKPPEFLSTHPAEATRIKDLEKLVPEAMEYYRPAGTTEQSKSAQQPQGKVPAPSLFPPQIK